MAFVRLILAVSCCAALLVRASKVDDVQDLNFEPRIAVQCGRVTKHVDVNNGRWTDDSSSEEFCSSDPNEILKYCQKTYPDIKVTNIVEANDNVTICSGENCQSSYTVVPYRCLVGKFEADALTYPFDADCDFGYVHEEKTCKNHEFWHQRAEQICEGKGKYVEKYGILVPCGTDVFTGVEYVCCKKSVGKPTAGKPVTGERTTEKPKTDHEILEDLLNKFATRIPKKSKGCDRSIYNTKTELVRQQKDDKVRNLAKDLDDAKSRMEELKKDDPDQAKDLFKKTLQIYQGTLKNIEKQAKLDETRLSQEKKECTQMNLNHKKHLAMTAFVDAVRQHKDEPNRIIRKFQRFMNLLENDQDQNMRSLSKKLLQKGTEKLMPARDQFLSHLNVVKNVLKEGVDILRKVESVQHKIGFDLPPFAGDINFEFAKTTQPPPPTTTKAPAVEDFAHDGTLGLNEEERSPENEHDSTSPTEDKPRVSDDDHYHGKPREHPLKSRAVFAAVIGLSCGALVIMIVIVVALFFRKGSSRRNTKTVIADDDSQEKRHLMKMQEDGFENPTYKFFAN